MPRSPSALGVARDIASAASRIILNVPIRLMLTARTNPASECGPSFPTTRSPWTMPAQLTRPWMLPNDSTASATAAFPLASSQTSVRMNRIDEPNDAASASPSSTLRSAMTTRAPPPHNIRAVAAPSPEAPPVTMKPAPFSSIDAPDSKVVPRATPRSGRCRADARRPLHDRHRRRDDAGDIRDVGRQDQRVRRTREIAELRDVFFGDAQIDRLQSAFRGDRFGDLPNRLGRCLRFDQRGRRFTLREIDLRLLLAF